LNTDAAEGTILAANSTRGEARLTRGDLEGDGSLDVFLSDRQHSQLWENEGWSRLRSVIDQAGSLGCKTPSGLAHRAATLLIHDGRRRPALCCPHAALLWHLNRGFRCSRHDHSVRSARTL